MKTEKVERALVAAGFEPQVKSYEAATGMPRSYEVDVGSSRWRLTASVPKEVEIERFSVSLTRADGFDNGTRFEIVGDRRIRGDLKSVMKEAKRLVANDGELMLCETCRNEFVYVNYARHSGRPFLSCDGMSRERRRWKKTRCLGTSARIEAVKTLGATPRK